MQPVPPVDAPRFHTDEELVLELPAPLLDWVRRAAIAKERMGNACVSTQRRPVVKMNVLTRSRCTRSFDLQT